MQFGNNFLNSDHHRSRKRIRDIGEVFTPDKYVHEMLDLLDKSVWSDDSVVFFEPCCGHGNIVLAIYRRRLDSLYRKVFSQYSENAALYAIANSLNTLWAIDIDQYNVNNCRSRILFYTLAFMKSKMGYENELDLISNNEDFFAHVLSAIKWQVHENETLSSLSSPNDVARKNASKTKSGKKWFNRHGHQQMDFNLTWVKFFKECEFLNSIPIDFEKSSLFIKNLIRGRGKLTDEFSFAKFLFENKCLSNKRQSQGINVQR